MIECKINNISKSFDKNEEIEGLGHKLIKY